MNTQKNISNRNYGHYNDYVFKDILQTRANGLLKFLNIPYKITSVLASEYTHLGPSISRVDFVGQAQNHKKTISLIIECQSKIPNDDDIKRFFQYVSSIRIFKNNNVELFILCVEKAGYDKKEFVINDDCIYTMHIISLKDFKATEIFKNIEDKLKTNREISQEDIASLQVIVYTDYDQTKLQILNRARKLLDEISEKQNMDINEKCAIIYLFDILSTNMLDDEEHERYMEENSMLVNPRERYFKKQGIDEGKREVAVNMLEKGFSMEMVVELTGLSRNDILNAK